MLENQMKPVLFHMAYVRISIDVLRESGHMRLLIYSILLMVSGLTSGLKVNQEHVFVNT